MKVLAGDRRLELALLTAWRRGRIWLGTAVVVLWAVAPGRIWLGKGVVALWAVLPLFLTLTPRMTAPCPEHKTNTICRS